MLTATHKIALNTNNAEREVLARHAGYGRFTCNTAQAEFKAGLGRRRMARG